MGKERVLITGENGYIGTHAAYHLRRGGYDCRTVSVRDGILPNMAGWDVIIHAAGYNPRITDDMRPGRRKSVTQSYFDVNTTLTAKLAQQAKAQGVAHFIFLSSMDVYGAHAGPIHPLKTETFPLTPFANSKMVAEMSLRALEDARFNIAYLRLPVVYGPGKPNDKWLNTPFFFGALARCIASSPVFPLTNARLSVLHVENLCVFLRMLIDAQGDGIFAPQDHFPVPIAALARDMAAALGKRCRFSRFTGFLARKSPFMAKFEPFCRDFIYDGRETDYFGGAYAVRQYDNA
jgi:UDP-glucose 4-epimerase